MCGIAGIINFNQKPVNQKDLEEMIEKVSYRGPDDRGYFIKENVGLSHCRLAIIDLSKAAHQPMSNENGSIWIVYNGEIYNYLELRKELERRGHIFKSNSDTEVALHGYEEWGEKGFRRFNGMWALAILDLVNKKVILSRDRFSIKPLYYTFSGSSFYFASEIKQLLSFLKKKQLNQEILFKFLRQAIIDFDHQTFFKNIYRVKPAHNLIVDFKKAKIKEVKYWDYYSEKLPKDENEVRERFRELFEDAVKIRLRSDVPIGGLVSGGLDSSSIAVVANKLQSGNFDCFSVVSQDKKYSEEKFVDILKEETNIKIEKLTTQPQLVWDKLAEVLWHHDEPFAGFSVVVHNQIIELIKKNTDIKVLLSGQGGDEILSGYRKFFFFYLAEEFKKKHFSYFFKNIFFSLVNKTILWQFFREPQLWPVARKYFPERPAPIDKILRIKEKSELIGRAESLRKRQILDIDKYSVPALNHYEDRNSMAYSLEIRLPFLDYRLVNFALNLPSFLKIRNGWPKYILRKSIDGLPERISWRKDKLGFVNPEEKWIKGIFQERIINLFKKSKLAEMGVVDKEQLLKSYLRFLKGERKLSHLDFARFAIAEFWLKNF